MRTMYKTGGYGELIEPVEVTRETEKSVWTVRWDKKVRRQSKRSDCFNFFDTRGEARTFLIEKAQAKVERICRALDRAESELTKANELPLTDPNKEGFDEQVSKKSQ